MVFGGYSGFPLPVTTGLSRLSHKMAEKAMVSQNTNPKLRFLDNLIVNGGFSLLGYK